MQNREFDVLLEWLMKNAGPIIRFRTAVELLREEGRASALRKDLMASDLLQFWLGNLNSNPGRKTLHGAKTGTYENVMGKLFEFGLKKGNSIMDSKPKPFRRWLKQQIRLSNERAR